MNLHGMVSGVINAVNPAISATLRRNASTYSTADDGTRTPNYTADEIVSLQLQGLSEKELAHLNELNIGGVLRKIYFEGSLTSMDRKAGSGGDLLVIDSITWLVVQVLEQWPDWVSAVIQKQAD